MKRVWLLVLVLCTFSQAATVYRVDPVPVMTVSGTVPIGGYPHLLAVSGATIGIFTDSAGTIPATAYTDSTGSTTCPVNAPVVAAGTAACSATSGQQGQFGFWLAAATYYYRVTLPNGTAFGPYALSVPAVQALPASSAQLQYLRTQPNSGNTTTYQFAALPVSSSADYAFSAQTPGGTLSAGACFWSMAPIPLGVTTGDTLYLTAGTGGMAEAVVVSVSGPTTVSATCAQAHGSGWQVESTSGGLQEAICALPSAGGTIMIPSGLALLANVVDCGKTAVRLEKLAGTTITGSFTLLSGSSVGTGQAEEFVNTQFSQATPGPAWASFANNWSQFAINVNSYPASSYFGENTTAIPQAIVGALNIPSNSAGSNHGAGLAGYALTKSTTVGAVGAFGFGGAAASGTSGWGGNLLVTNCSQPQCATQTGLTNTVLYGLEIDANEYLLPGAGTPNTSLRGIYIIGASEVKGSGINYGVDIDSFGYLQSPKLKWDSAFRTEDGIAVTGLDIGTTGTGNNVGSQPINFRSRNGGGTNLTSTIQADAGGDLVVQPAPNTVIALQDGNGNSVLQTNGSTNTVNLGASTNLLAPNIKSTTGQRYVCVTTTGQLVSSASACSGT